MQTADKATLEIFKASSEENSDGASDLAQEIVRRAILPAVEIGGDSRLQMPPPNRVQSKQIDHAHQVSLINCFSNPLTIAAPPELSRILLRVASSKLQNVLLPF